MNAKRMRRLLATTVFACGLAGPASATIATASSGDLGVNVIAAAGNFQFNFDLTGIAVGAFGELDIKYGLFNSPDVPVDVFFNGNLVGNFLADQGYSSPGPEFLNDVNVNGLVVSGINTVLFTGNNINFGDYVVGQIDLTYDNLSAVPEPGTLAIFGIALIALACRRRKAAV